MNFVQKIKDKKRVRLWLLLFFFSPISSFAILHTSPPPNKASFLSQCKNFIHSPKGKILSSIIQGDTCQIKPHLFIAFEGLALGLVNDISYPEGLWMGQKVALLFRPSPEILYTLSPALYFTTKSKKYYGYIHSSFLFGDSQRKKLSLSAGFFNYDLEKNRLIAEEKEAIALLNFARGVQVSLRYESIFLRLENQWDINDKISFCLSSEWRKVFPIKENLYYPLYPPSFQTNNKYSSQQIPLHKSFEISTDINFYFAPNYVYNKWGRKILSPTTFYSPHLRLSYRHALALSKAYSQYLFLSLSLRQHILFSPKHRLRYQFELAHYFQKKQIYPEDESYLKGCNSLSLISNKTPYSFHTPWAYTPMGTSSLRLYTIVDMPIFLATRFQLGGKSFSESLYLNAFWGIEQPKSPYLEMGYSLEYAKIIRLCFFYGGYNFYQNAACCFRAMLLLDGLKNIFS